MTRNDFITMVNTQEFFDFEFKNIPLSEVKEGQFFSFLGTFYIAGQGGNALRPVSKVFSNEFKLIPSRYKVSAIINY